MEDHCPLRLVPVQQVASGSPGGIGEVGSGPLQADQVIRVLRWEIFLELCLDVLPVRVESLERISLGAKG